LLPILIFFISFATYLFTAVPTLYWRDGPEFQAIGFLLDIAHPAGSPLYAMVTKLFTFLPLGNIAFKTTLVSSFFGAAVCVLVYLIVRSVLEQITKGSASSPGLIRWVAFFTALTFSFSDALWKVSNVPEVYALQNFFTAIFLFILLKVQQVGFGSPHSRRRLFQLFLALSFLFGLSLGAHAILVLYLPFLFIWTYFVWLKPVSLKAVKGYSVLFFFFLLGFSVYLYLPLRSTQDPYYDWGNPETFNNLIVHGTDRKDAYVHFSVKKSVLPRQLKMYSGFYPDNFSFLGTMIGLAGLTYLISKRERRLLALFLMFFLPPWLFFIRYWGGSSAYLPTLLIFNILIGIGVWAISTIVKRRLEQHHLRAGYLTFIWLLLGIQLFLLFSDHLRQNSKGDYWAPRQIMRNILTDLPFHTVIIGSHTWFAFNYLQQSEGYRPDLTVFSLSSFIAPDLFSPFDESRFPNVVIPNVPPEKFGSAFLTENIHSRPIYWEPTVNRNYMVEEYLIPEGFLFKVDPGRIKIDGKTVQSYVLQLSDQIDLEKTTNNLEERAFYANVISGQGTFFLERGIYEAALYHFKLAAALAPSKYNLNILGVGYATAGEYRLAEEMFLKAIAMDPNNFEPNLNMGEMYVERNMPEQAEPYLGKVLFIYPDNIRALYLLGEINAEKGEEQMALDYFQKVLKIDPDHQDAKRQVDKLLKTHNARHPRPSLAGFSEF
ncbi:MAG: protein O-mannosyl-transferase family, partial [Nitrospiria bacterium]